jgi:hypothetical protein
MLGDARKDICGGTEPALPGAPACGMSRGKPVARFKRSPIGSQKKRLLSAHPWRIGDSRC